MPKLTVKEIMESGVTEEQAKKIFKMQNKDRRVYNFLSYKGPRGYISEKIQTFKLNYFFFKIPKKSITTKEKGQLLNNGYKYRTLKKEDCYLFFLEDKAREVSSGLGISYFSKLKDVTVVKSAMEKEKKNNELLDSARLYVKQDEVFTGSLIPRTEFLDFSGEENK